MTDSKNLRRGRKAGTTSAYMALQEVAELFGVHEATIRRWISNGRLTGYMVGPNTIRVRRDEVLALPRPIPTVGGAA